MQTPPLNPPGPFPCPRCGGARKKGVPLCPNCGARFAQLSTRPRRTTGNSAGVIVLVVGVLLAMLGTVGLAAGCITNVATPSNNAPLPFMGHTPAGDMYGNVGLVGLLVGVVMMLAGLIVILVQAQRNR